MLLGCIADDFTGATDLANNLVRGGMRCCRPSACRRAPPGSRRGGGGPQVAHIAPRRGGRAVAGGARWLRAKGCRQFYFKYCSTFDSTPGGNIGPVAEALMQAFGTLHHRLPGVPGERAHHLPGPPVRGRPAAVESGMRDHPLTPMKDANLVRVLQAQTRTKSAWSRSHGGQRRGGVRERLAALERKAAASPWSMPLPTPT